MSYIEFTKKNGIATAQINTAGLDSEVEKVKASIVQNTINTTTLVQEGIALQKELDKLLAVKDNLNTEPN